MNYKEMQDVMYKVFNECDMLRQAGQAEYARSNDDALANFKRVALLTGVTPKQALVTYAAKHWDGIISYINGHTSQREAVEGRINDFIVYMCLLRGMIEEEREADKRKALQEQSAQMQNDPRYGAPEGLQNAAPQFLEERRGRRPQVPYTPITDDIE